MIVNFIIMLKLKLKNKNYKGYRDVFVFTTVC